MQSTDPPATDGTAVRVLSAFGGFFASLLFLLFIWLSGVIDSRPLSIGLGVALVLTAIVLGRNRREAFLSTVIVCGYLVGMGLILAAFPPYRHEGYIVLPVLAVAVATLLFTRNYLMLLLAVVSLPGCLLYLHLTERAFWLVDVAVALSATGLVVANLLEPRLHARPRFSPLRVGLVLAVFMTLAYHRWGYWLIGPNTTVAAEWPLAAVLYALTLLVAWRTLERGWVIALALLLLPLTLLPLLLGSFLLLFVSFRNQHFFGIGTGITALLYFTAQYYYDLRWDLLDKSLVLMGSGALLLGAYIIVQRKFSVRA